MSVSAADGTHEFVVAPELAEVAERLHASDRVRFEVTDGEREVAPRRWLGTVSTGEHTLSERAKVDIRDGMGRRTD